jgi:hypothetical protein
MKLQEFLQIFDSYAMLVAAGSRGPGTALENPPWRRKSQGFLLEH